MRGIKDKKTGGMNLKKPKISLILIFTIILSIFIGLYSAKKADAAIANVNQWSATAVFDAATNPSTGTAYSYAAGANRLVVVAVEYETSAVAAHTVAVTYGGTALTQILNNVAQRQNIWIGYIKEASLPASGSNIVSTITLGGTATLTRQTIHAATYSGVDQTTPIVASNAQASASAANLTYTGISVTNGGYIFYDWNFNTTVTGAQDSNNGTGYTEHFDQLYTTYNLSLASKPITATGTETVTVTTTQAASRCALSVVSLNPAATGDSVNVADGTDPANANAGRGSVNNVADSFTMVSTNIQNGLAAVTGVTASLSTPANISGVRLYKDNGVAGTYESGTDILLSTGTPGASVSFTGFTENLTTSATNYLILVDIASGATLTQTIDTSVTAVTVTAPDAQGTISDASNPTRLTVIDSPHEDAATALNTAIATTPILESTSGVLMQRFQVSSSTSGSGAQDNQLELNSLGIDDLGTATGARTAKAYIDTTSSATLPGTAVLIGTLSAWTGAPTTITLDQGTAGDRTVANATPKYIYIVYDLPGGATQTVQASITSVGVVSPDAGQTGLTLNSNIITLSADPSQITSCGGCHGYGATLTDGTARNVPNGKFPGSHNKHVNTYSKACSVCHTTPATETSADFNHRNGTVQMASPINGNAGAAYTKGASWTQVYPNAALTACTNTYCHSNGTSVITGSIPSNTSAVWGANGTVNCTSCHGAGADGRPDYANNTPKRNAHGDVAGTYGVTHKANACTTCHTGVSGSAGAYAVDPATHNNAAYNLSGTFGYTQATGVCSTPGCHGTATWGGAALTCLECHNGVVSAPNASTASGGTVTQRQAAVGEFGLAWGHKAGGKTPVRGAVTVSDCIVCHLEGVYATQAKSATYHGDGYIDLRDPDVAGETRITNIAGTSYRFVQFSTSYAAGARTSTGNVAETVDNILTQKFCLACHDSNGATNTTARSTYGTPTAFMPFGGVNLGATYTVANGAAAAGGLIDVKTQLATTNSSYHPVLGPLNRDFPTAAILNDPYKNTGSRGTSGTRSLSVVINCFDCHNTPTTPLTNRTVTAHGNANSLRGFPVATTEATGVVVSGVTLPTVTTRATLCLVCHIPGTSTMHLAGSAFTNTGSGAMSAFIQWGCNQCHSSSYNTAAVRPVRAMDVHGVNILPTNAVSITKTGRWLGTATGTPATVDARPYGFIRNTQIFPDHAPKRNYNSVVTYTSAYCMAGNVAPCSRAQEVYTPGGSY